MASAAILALLLDHKRSRVVGAKKHIRKVLLVVNLSNLKFLALTYPEIWSGSQNYKSRSPDPVWPNFAYFVRTHPSCSICMPYL